MPNDDVTLPMVHEAEWAVEEAQQHLRAVDNAKVTTGKLLGPTNVPSYSKYRYHPQGAFPLFPTGVWNPDGGTTPPITKSSDAISSGTRPPPTASPDGRAPPCCDRSASSSTSDCL